MRFYKNNAYPEIFLHDCRFKMAYENKNLRLIFEDGFAVKTGNCIEKKKGYIQISDMPLIEISIRGLKGEMQGNIYKETVAQIEFSDLCLLLRNSFLEVVDEYYNCMGLLYRCCITPYHENQKFDRIELTIDFEHRALEYYMEK